MNFPIKWREWIKSCIISESASILINESPTTPFKLHRGLRQGESLSHFLFDLVVEVLNLLICKAISIQFWNGIDVGKNGVTISHLCRWHSYFYSQDIKTILNIKKVLILFHLASSLQVNFHKTSLIGINVDQNWLLDAAGSLLCKIGTLPFSYLGLLIGGKTSQICL